MKKEEEVGEVYRLMCAGLHVPGFWPLSFFRLVFLSFLFLPSRVRSVRFRGVGPGEQNGYFRISADFDRNSFPTFPGIGLQSQRWPDFPLGLSPFHQTSCSGKRTCVCVCLYAEIERLIYGRFRSFHLSLLEPVC